MKEKKGFLSWYEQNFFTDKEKLEESKKRQAGGECIDWWSRLSPEQKNVLPTGSLEGLENTQKVEKSNSSQIEQQGANHRFRPTDFTVEIPERHYGQFDLDRQTRLIQEYLDAVEEVKKNKKLQIEQKLKKLLTPLINLCDTTFPQGHKTNLKFIEEDINLKEELDIGNLINNSKKYTIDEDLELKELGLLRVKNKNICLSERYTDYLLYCEQVAPMSEAEFEKIPYEKEYIEKAGQNLPDGAEVLIEPDSGLFSVSEIYIRWLPSLTPEKMKSNDLLVWCPVNN